MQSFVVLAANSLCGPMTIQADSPMLAAKLYSDNCCNCDGQSGNIWVWTHSDYHTDPGSRPDPMEYPLCELLEGA